MKTRYFLMVLGLALPAVAAAQPSDKTLTVTIAPGGGGTVVSAPPGINCPGDCTETYTHGTDVTLTPTADVGKIFTGSVAIGRTMRGLRESLSPTSPTGSAHQTPA